MTDAGRRPETADDLRRRALALARLEGAEPPATAADALRLVHELRVHQIELWLQNDELQATTDRLATLLARYTALYEGAPAGYVTLDRDAKIMEINGCAASLLGADIEQLRGRRLALFIVEAERRAFSDFLDALDGAEVVRSCEVQIDRRGPPVFVRIEGSRVTETAESRLVLLDTTALRAANATQRLQSLALDAADDAIMIMDPGGTIRWANAAFAALTGVPIHEAIGVPRRNVLRRADAVEPEIDEAVWSQVLQGQVWHGETQNRRPDGTAYSAQHTITPVRNAQGQVTHVIAIGHDLTMQRQLEAQLLQAQKMETVGRLAGGIAHDFNNLLTVINGTASLALATIDPSSAVASDLLDIRRAGERAAALTAQLLAFSRKQIMHFEPVRVGEMLVGMEGMLRRLIGEHITLVVTQGTQDDWIAADVAQLEHVVMNLVVNARDAMPEGGTLTIATALGDDESGMTAEHPSLPAGPHVMLSVTDTGEGMSAETAAHIFEPFFTTKPVGLGTGLGLATVYGIVQQSRGSINVRSIPGTGTTMTLLFPLTARTDAPAVTTGISVPAADHGHESILLVEDEESVRRLGQRVLERAGYRVHVAANGAEALEIVATTRSVIALVITDLIMPVMGGVALARILAEKRPGLPVVFTSGYEGEPIVGAMLELPGHYFIAKPYSAAQLTSLVRNVIDRAAVQS